ncbi:MAG: ABC transporter substrate-binding protein [bacterium]|nr:ABC transporter substrate-binding protein [bacterium]
MANRIRYWTRLFSTFLNKFKGLLLISSVIGIAIFLIIPRLSFFWPYISRGEAIGIVGKYTTEDIPFDIQKEMSMGLTTLDSENNVKPGLADSWQAENDGKVWIFKLGDKKWQDGTKVVAKDINYKFSDAKIEIVDNQTIKFVLTDYFSPLPSVVIRPVFKRGFLGAGDWKVVKLSLAKGTFVESLRLQNLQTKKIKTYKFYLTEDDARTAFKLGEVDKLKDLVDPRELSNWKGITLSADSRLDQYVGVFFNYQDKLLGDKRIRQALAYAINKDNFLEERAVSTIASNSWAFNPQSKPYEHNPKRAKELIAEFRLERKDEELTVNLATTPSLLPVADKIKADWEAVGVKTRIQVSNTPSLEFQSLLAIQPISPDPDQYGLWHSTQTASNITHYGNSNESKRIDKLLEDGRRTLNLDERKAIYYDFQRFIMEDSPVAILYHPITYSVERNRLLGK